MTSLLDWQHLDRKIQDCIERNTLPGGRAFSLIALKALFDIPETECGDYITDGGDDRGIDAVYIEKKSGINQIHLMQFKWHRDFHSPLKKFPGSAIDPIIGFFGSLMKNPDSLETSCNPSLLKKCEEIRSILGEERPQFHVHLCSNGAYAYKRIKERLEDGLSEYGDVSIYEHGLSDFVDIFVDRSRPRINKTIATYCAAPIEKIDGNIKGAVFIARGKEIVKLVALENDPARITHNVFHDNIRMFLGYKAEFNKNIRGSALSEDNHLFWYLNNGLTIVCDDFEFQKGLDRPPIIINNLQIVNGRQTIQALFDAYQDEPDKVAGTEILVRLYATKDKDTSFWISETTNSQHRISSRNLKSRDAIQLQLRDFFRDRGRNYKRLPHEFDNIPQEKVVDSLRLGQVCLSYYLEFPHRAKTQSDAIFDSYYHDIFNAGMNFDECVLVYDLYNLIETRRYIESANGQKNGDPNVDFLGYAHFFILYGFRVLSKKYAIGVPNMMADFEQHYSEILNSLRALLSIHKMSSYDFFRSSKMRDHFKDALNNSTLRLFD